MEHNLLQISPRLIGGIIYDRKFEFRTNVEVRGHWAMLAVEEGTFSYRIGSSSGEASFGDIVFCPSGVPFEREIVETPLTFFFSSFSWLHDTEGAVSEKIAYPTGKIAIHDTERLASTYAQIKKLIFQMDPLTMRLQNHLLYDVWSLYILQQSHAFTPLRKGTDDALMQKAKQHLRTHAFSQLTLATLAKSMGISSPQLTKRFKASFGVTPLAYLTQLRIRRAQMLLLNTDLGLEEIAAQCGYEDGFYLSRVFLRTTHMRPSQFRQTHRL